MDRKTQEIFFRNTVDMDALAKCASEIIDQSKKAGGPKRLKIEIRKVEEFDSKLSLDEIFEQIDNEYSKENVHLNMLRATKVDNYFVIVGVKL